jgi:ArsR family transcriptional regulator
MNSKRQVALVNRARVFKSLAHPSRRFILEQLIDGERCVYELTDMTGADMSTVSKHLSVLKSAGVIQDEKRGLQVYSSLKTPYIVRCLDCGAEYLKQMQKSNRKLRIPVRSMWHEAVTPEIQEPVDRGSYGLK